MKEINVMQIMEEIREDIKKKGLSDDLLSFSEVVVTPIQADTSSMNVDIDIIGQLEVASRSRELHFYREYPGNRIETFFKRLIRKIIKPIVLPLCEEQILYNVSSVEVMKGLYTYMQKQEAEKVALVEKVNSLEREVAKLQEQATEGK